MVSSIAISNKFRPHLEGCGIDSLKSRDLA